MKRFTRWLALLLASCGAAPLAYAQTVTSPVITRTDTLARADVKLTYPAAFDSSRVKFTACVQVRTAGVNGKEVCRTKTGPWLRRVFAPPPPPVPAPTATIMIVPPAVLAGDSATATWACTNAIGATIGDASQSLAVPLTMTTKITQPNTYILTCTAADGRTVTASATLSLTTPPPPVVQTFWTERNPSAFATDADSVEVCAFLRFTDGVVATSANAKVGACAARLTVHQQGRLPSLAQQALADTACTGFALKVIPGKVSHVERVRVMGTRSCRAFVYAQ